MRALVLSLFALATAISDAEKSLAKFLVNRTEPADEPCFRAEFVVKIRSDSNNQGGELDFNEIKPIVGLSNKNVNRNESNCDLLQIDDIVTDDGGNYSLAFVINVVEKSEGQEWWEIKEITLTNTFDQVQYKNDSMQHIAAPLAGTWGQSFLCNAGFNVELWNENMDHFVTINLARLQIQPHKVPADTFANPVICEEDINIVIPAIVGSILGILVLVVLVTYIIGRKRTRIAYQEI